MVNAWHGPLDSIGQWDVFESPARAELAKRLLSGHAVVWLVVTSNDEAQNAKARTMLAESLETLADKVELPDGIGLPGSELLFRDSATGEVQYVGDSQGAIPRRSFWLTCFRVSVPIPLPKANLWWCRCLEEGGRWK